MLFASFLYIYICVWIEIDQILRPIRKLKDKEDHSRSSVSRVLVVRIESRSRALIATSYRDIFSKGNSPVGKWEKFLAKMMESITKAGRSVSNGVYRVAGAFARGARRVLSYVPLLGVAVAPPELEEVEEAEASSLVLAELFHSLAWVIVIERFPSLLEIFPCACHRTLSQMARIN